MKYVPLGRSGVFVSELCLGTAAFGKEAGESDSVAIMNRAIEAGINFFDIDGGLSEEMVGRWIGPHREAIILAAQIHSAMDERHIILSVEQSLQRLHTDWIDILYLRHEDDGDGIEQALEAVSTLIGQGKVMYCGLAGFAAWQTMKAGNLAPIVCIRPVYNLVERQAEVEILPQAHSEGLAVFPCNPVADGLTKNDRDAAISERFLEYARKKGLSPAALAVAWVAAHPAVTAPILGAANLEELDELLQCLDIVLNEEQRAEITALSIDPPLATDR